MTCFANTSGAPLFCGDRCSMPGKNKTCDLEISIDNILIISGMKPGLSFPAANKTGTDITAYFL